MNVILQTAITNKIDVCLADIAEIAVCANKAALKMPYPELNMKTDNLNIFQIPTNA